MSYYIGTHSLKLQAIIIFKIVCMEFFHYFIVYDIELLLRFKKISWPLPLETSFNSDYKISIFCFSGSRGQIERGRSSTSNAESDSGRQEADQQQQQRDRQERGRGWKVVWGREGQGRGSQEDDRR